MLPWSWDNHWGYLRMVEMQCFETEELFINPQYDTNGVYLYIVWNENIKHS